MRRHSGLQMTRGWKASDEVFAVLNMQVAGGLWGPSSSAIRKGRNKNQGAIGSGVLRSAQQSVPRTKAMPMPLFSAPSRNRKKPRLDPRRPPCGLRPRRQRLGQKSCLRIARALVADASTLSTCDVDHPVRGTRIEPGRDVECIQPQHRGPQV